MKIKFLIIIVCMLIIQNGCKGKQDQSIDARSNSIILKNDSAINQFFSDSIEMFFHSKGVASFIFSDNNCKKFNILNKNGTVFATIDIAKDRIIINDKELVLSQFSYDNALKLKYDFEPKEFYPELSVIQFEYLQIKQNKIEVYLNKQKKITKFIEPNCFKLEEWRKHLIGCMVDFDKNNNFIREKPEKEAVSLHYEDSDEDLIFIISEIKGDWVKLECVEICDYTCNHKNKFNGWIMWKQFGKMIIQLLYSC